jgi:DNA repair protein RecO (recombination protein O)
MSVFLEPGFILHHRPYRETSVLLDIFTEKHGRIALIARGTRTHRSRLRSLLQPFIPLLLSWHGQGELMLMKEADNHGAAIWLQGDRLFSGFYLNELLIRVLQKNDPHPGLYTIYHQTLLELQHDRTPQRALRLFEKKCLEELGYGLSFHDVTNGKNVQPDRSYHFFPGRGFVEHTEEENKDRSFKGESLLAFAEEQLFGEDSLRDAKRLMRIAIASLLGLKNFHSRQLFQPARNACQTVE